MQREVRFRNARGRIMYCVSQIARKKHRRAEYSAPQANRRITNGETYDPIAELVLLLRLGRP